MYGFWRLGFSPTPSGGAAWVTKGLATATSTSEKKPITTPRTGTAHAVSIPAALRASSTAAVE